MQRFAQYLVKGTKIGADDLVQTVWLELIKNPRGHMFLDKPCLIQKMRWRFIDLLRKQESQDRRVRNLSVHKNVFGAKHTKPEISRNNLEKTLFWMQYHSIDLTDQQKDIVWMSYRKICQNRATYVA